MEIEISDIVVLIFEDYPVECILYCTEEKLKNHDYVFLRSCWNPETIREFTTAFKGHEEDVLFDFSWYAFDRDECIEIVKEAGFGTIISKSN